MQSINYLDYAFATERWIHQQAQQTDNGTYWMSEDEKSVKHPVLRSNLFAGASGIVLFYLEMYHQTGEPLYLERAEAGARYILNSIPEQLYVKKITNIVEFSAEWELNDQGKIVAKEAAEDANQISLYVGVSGMGFALGTMYRVTGKQAYKGGALKVAKLLQQGRLPGIKGASWVDVPELMFGDAGAGLFLLYAAEELGDAASLALAEEVGESILAKATHDPAGIHWPTNAVFFGDDHPNFLHGTAGVGYFLMRLYQQTGNEKYFQAAQQAGHYLAAQANETTGLIPYQTSNNELFLYGFSHGPVGTSRFLEKLEEKLEAQPLQQSQIPWSPVLARSGQTLIDNSSHILGRKSEGLWNSVNQLNGSSGIADYFLKRYHKYEESKYLDTAKLYSQDVIDRAVQDGDALYWPHQAVRLNPDAIAAHTGLLNGSAGIGLHFLRMHALETDSEISVRLLDDR